MFILFDKNAVMDIPCLDCKHIKKLTISEIESNHTFICEGCGKQITIDGAEFTKGLVDAKQFAVNSLNNAFKGFKLK